MEYAKDGAFQIRYNTKLNRLERVKENWTSRCYKRIKEHKLLTTAIVSFILFSMINMVMIYSFMKILQNL